MGVIGQINLTVGPGLINYIFLMEVELDFCQDMQTNLYLRRTQAAHMKEPKCKTAKPEKPGLQMHSGNISKHTKAEAVFVIMRGWGQDTGPFRSTGTDVPVWISLYI